MTRTEVLQETWWMGFEEAYGGWQERRLTREEARLLGECERTFRRYEDEGLDGRFDKRLSPVLRGALVQIDAASRLME